MEIYYITIGTSKEWTKRPQRDIARTLLTKESGGGGILMVDEVKCEQLGLLTGEKWEKMHDISRRVYGTDGLSPTLHTCGGGNLEPKVYENFRIRKLTPCECFRLMGVKDEDFDKVKKNQSNSSLYHLAGDSICVPVLMALFSKMVDIKWENKLWDIKKYTEKENI